MRIAHKGLQRLYESDDARYLNPEHLGRIRRMLSDLDAARQPRDLEWPGYRLHPMTGDMRGYWSMRVSANWRIVFRFADGEAVDVDLIDYHQEETSDAHAQPDASRREYPRSLEGRRMDGDGCRQAPRCYAKYALAPRERPYRRFTGNGSGPGAGRLEQRRILDEKTSRIRSCASAKRPGFGSVTPTPRVASKRVYAVIRG